MTKVAAVALLFYLFGTCAYGQDFWVGLELPDSIHSINSIEVSPNEDIVICTNKGLYKSSDNGESWIHFGNIHRTISQILFYNDSTFYAASGTLFYKSTNSGQTWDTVCSYSHSCNSLELLKDSLFFKACWGGIYKSTDWGVSWVLVDSTFSSQAFYDIVNYNGTFYTSSTAFMDPDLSGLYRSDDDGESWYHYSMVEYGIKPLHFDQDSNLLAGVGASWPVGEYPGLYSTGYPCNIWDNLYSSGEVYSIEVSPNGRIFIGLQSDISPEWGIRYSDDQGQTWEELNSGLTYSGYVEHILLNDQNYLFAVLHYNQYDSLYRSHNPLLAINETQPDQQNFIGVFPNPANDLLNIAIYETKSPWLRVVLYNTTGGILFSKTFTVRGTEKDGIQIDLGEYSSGIYILRLQGRTFSTTKLIIVI